MSRLKERAILTRPLLFFHNFPFYKISSHFFTTKLERSRLHSLKWKRAALTGGAGADSQL